MLAFLKWILQMTAWPMTPPTPYSTFHILLAISGTGDAVIGAVCCRRKMQRAARPEEFFRQLLFVMGLILMLMELYKQAFLYLIEFNGHFDWWYFPFQLCSVPMYLCLAVPLLRKEKHMGIVAAFLQDFGLLGGIMALGVPPGLMHPYWSMTMHGFLWHFILLFLGLFCHMSGRVGRRAADYARVLPLFLFCHMSGRVGRRAADYARVLPLFLFCCGLAVLINVLAGPTGDADMFYLSPYHLSNQPLFHEISAAAGILPANLLYVAAMALGGFLVHEICSVVSSFSTSEAARN